MLGRGLRKPSALGVPRSIVHCHAERGAEGQVRGCTQSSHLHNQASSNTFGARSQSFPAGSLDLCTAGRLGLTLLGCGVSWTLQEG